MHLENYLKLKIKLKKSKKLFNEKSDSLCFKEDALFFRNESIFFGFFFFLVFSLLYPFSSFVELNIIQAIGYDFFPEDTQGIVESFHIFPSIFYGEMKNIIAYGIQIESLEYYQNMFKIIFGSFFSLIILKTFYYKNKNNKIAKDLKSYNLSVVGVKFSIFQIIIFGLFIVSMFFHYEQNDVYMNFLSTTIVLFCFFMSVFPLYLIEYLKGDNLSKAKKMAFKNLKEKKEYVEKINKLKDKIDSLEERIVLDPDELKKAMALFKVLNDKEDEESIECVNYIETLFSVANEIKEKKEENDKKINNFKEIIKKRENSLNNNNDSEYLIENT